MYLILNIYTECHLVSNVLNVYTERQFGFYLFKYVNLITNILILCQNNLYC